MTTNNLSLKSHVLTEKDLGLPVCRSPKSMLLLAVLMYGLAYWSYCSLHKMQ